MYYVAKSFLLVYIHASLTFKQQLLATKYVYIKSMFLWVSTPKTIKQIELGIYNGIQD